MSLATQIIAIAKRVALTATVVSAPLGCQPRYDGLEIRYLNGTGEFSQRGIELAEGQALVIEVSPRSGNPFEDYENFDLVELAPYEGSVLAIAPATDIDQFVLMGVRVGQTAVRVSINDEKVDVINAIVHAQEAP